MPQVCFLCVEVKSRGQVVSAGRSSADLTLVPEASWSPVARVVVYAVISSGEIVNDVIELPVPPTLQNEVLRCVCVWGWGG